MPRLWSETVEDHRHDVRQAVLDATDALWHEHGPLSLTMSQIAREAGIGRATLYKYFSDVESIAIAWHERKISGHIAQLDHSRLDGQDPWQRFEGTLRTYANIRRGSHDQDPSELGQLLHHSEHVVRAEQHLHTLFRDLISDAAEAGAVRRDLAPDEMANFCLHAASAASDLESPAAIRRLVGLILKAVKTAD